MTGVEPVTSSLPRKRSTTELHRLLKADNKHVRHKVCSLCTIYLRILNKKEPLKQLERETRFEPATLTLEGLCSTN